MRLYEGVADTQLAHQPRTHRVSSRQRVWPKLADLMLGLAVLATWILVFPRLVPDRSDDRGIFVSVAERLLAGDILYSEVYDNKEPLFLYFVAVQRALGAIGELAAEAMLIGSCALLVYFVAVRLYSRRTAVAISFVALPLVVTGEFYVPGATYLPAICLTLAVFAACFHHRPALGGALLATLLFTKLILVPVAFAASACVLLPRRRVSDVVALTIGAGGACVLILAVLLTRGELWPFIDTLKLNVSYAQGGLVAGAKGVAALAAHIQRVVSVNFVGELAAIGAAIMLVVITRSPSSHARQSAPVIANAGVWTLFASLFVLAVTGLWPQHNQILYIPAIFAMLGLGAFLDTAYGRARLAALGFVVLMAYLLAGIPGPKSYVAHLADFTRAYSSLSALPPESSRLLSSGPAGTYARIGRNDDLGHAFGTGAWKLQCARFHQYEFESEALLAKVFDCASRAPTLLIGTNFRPDFGAHARAPWNGFVARVERLVSESYACDARSGLRICKRLPASNGS